MSSSCETRRLTIHREDDGNSSYLIFRRGIDARLEVRRRPQKFAVLVRYVGVLPAKCRVARGESGPRSERDRTNCPGGEVPSGVRLQPDLGPHGHGAWDLGALGQRQGGVFRSTEHQPRALRDEQPNHGHLLRSGRRQNFCPNKKIKDMMSVYSCFQPVSRQFDAELCVCLMGHVYLLVCYQSDMLCQEDNLSVTGRNIKYHIQRRERTTVSHVITCSSPDLF